MSLLQDQYHRRDRSLTSAIWRQWRFGWLRWQLVAPFERTDNSSQENWVSTSDNSYDVFRFRLRISDAAIFCRMPQMRRQNWVSGTGNVKMAAWSSAALSATVGWFDRKDGSPENPARNEDIHSIWKMWHEGQNTLSIDFIKKTILKAKKSFILRPWNELNFFLSSLVVLYESNDIEVILKATSCPELWLSNLSPFKQVQRKTI